MKLDIAITGPIQVNTYILKDEETKEAVLIDVGGSFNEIEKKLEQEGYSIKYILNTHGHFDHVLGELGIEDKYQIFMHKDDEFHLKNIKEEMLMFGFDKEAKPLNPTKYIDENSLLTIGNHKIEVFYTPGHSKGSLSFYVDNKVFTGDALFYNSIGRADFIDGDYDTLIQSIKEKLLVLPEDTKVYPGHGPSTTIAKEKKNNPYLK